MAKINLDMSSFGDIIISVLFDKVTHLDKIYNDSEAFNDLAKELRGRGFKTSFLQYWLESDSESRVKYKRIKRALESNKQVLLYIKPSKDTPEEEEEKSIIKRVGKILNKLRLKENLTEDEKEFARKVVKESID